MTSKLWRPVASVAAVAVFATALGTSAARAASQPTAVAGEVKAPAASSGLMVAIDEKGRIRQPTREEAQALVREVEALFHKANASVKQSADGVLSAELGEGFQSLYLARVNGDGSLATSCVDNPAAAVNFLLPAAGLEEK